MMQGQGTGPGGMVGVLNILAGNDRGKQYPLINPQTQIGRGADQDLILADIAVSRRHVVIAIEGERYRLQDLGSGNGTIVNGVRTATALLNDGDQIEIGSTLLRFEHPPSGRSHMAGPMAQASAQQRTMIAEAPSFAPPPMQQPIGGANPYSAPTPTPSEGVQMPHVRHPASVASPVVHSPSAGGGLLDSPVKKAAVFGALGVVVLLGVALTIKTVVGGGKAEAQKLFLEGKSAFATGDYDTAKKLFSDSLAKDPQLAEATKYRHQCDVEIFARGKIAAAQKYAQANRWEDELKALDSIDKGSATYDDAMKLRKAAIPEAIKSYLGDARQSMEDDPESAKQKIEAALELDPDNAEAQELLGKLKGGAEDKAGGDEGSKTKTVKEPKVAAAPKEPKPAREPKAAATSGGAVTKDDGGRDGGSEDLLASKGGAAYKAKDFNGAANALRLAAKSQKGAAAKKTLALAAQVQRLGEVYQKAEADKTKNPPSAVSGYQQAMGIDGQIGHGTHAAYFKSQVQKLATEAAKLAFAQQRFDTAFEMAKAAQRYGTSDGGVFAQLKTKAADLNNKAAAMVKSNPNGAKAMWRMVLRMVPPGDPAYAAAQKGLASSTGARDEDEE